MTTRALIAAVLMILSCNPLAAKESDMAPDVRIDRTVRIAMRDGLNLGGVLFRPANASGPLPTILAMTPYMADSWHDRAMFFARHGYNFLVVDHRGRGNSDGQFVPWEDDGRDGFDTVEWLARQSWSNGKAGMIGGSYSGANQWATLREGPKALKTIVPTASPFFGYDFPAHKGVLDAWFLNWYQGTYGRVLDKNYRDDYSFFTPVLRERYLAGQAYAGLADALGMPTPLLNRWLAHPSADAYWKALVPTTATFAAIDVPILTITGQFDGVQRGSLEYYRRQTATGSAGASKHYVVIGPWNHSGTRKPVARTGGLDVGAAAVIDIDALHLAWFDWTMKDGPRPAFLTDKVMYYVTDENAWHHAPSMAAISSGTWTLHLAGPGGASVEQPAMLSPKRARGTLSYIYDPAARRLGHDEPSYPDEVLLDTWTAHHLDGAGLVYETVPLDRVRTIAGRPRLVLDVTTDVPDTDIEATLYEIEPNGRSVRLSYDKLRLRYRNSLEKPEPMPISKSTPVVLPDFAFVARRLSAGSRIRLVVRAIDSIYTEKNYNSGGDVGRETVADARVAHVAISGELEVPTID